MKITVFYMNVHSYWMYLVDGMRSLHFSVNKSVRRDRLLSRVYPRLFQVHPISSLHISMDDTMPGL